MKKVISLIKKVIIASIILFTYNRLAISFDAVIPINIITIILVSIFGIPVIIALIIFGYLFF